jgi:hypothetical protein
MKVKLLKKIKARYNWYFNKDSFPVLIDHKEKRVTIYDLEYMCEYYKYSLEDVKEKVKVPHTEWALRRMKLDLLFEHGYQMNRSIYRIATRKYKSMLSKANH